MTVRAEVNQIHAKQREPFTSLDPLIDHTLRSHKQNPPNEGHQPQPPPAPKTPLKHTLWNRPKFSRDSTG